MTKREAAIVTAYTGYLIGDFNDFQAYADEKAGESTWTHQFASPVFADRLKALSKNDFINMKVEG